MDELNYESKKIVEMLYQSDLLETKIKEELSNEYKVYIEIMNNINEIDDIISDNLYNYTLNRLAYIDRAIIRLAVYELKYTKKDTGIIMNNAIDITKEISDLDDEKQHKFNNKLLDNINKNIRG